MIGNRECGVERDKISLLVCSSQLWEVEQASSSSIPVSSSPSGVILLLYLIRLLAQLNEIMHEKFPAQFLSHERPPPGGQ